MKVCVSCGFYRNEVAFPTGEYQDICIYCWNESEQDNDALTTEVKQ